MKETRIVIAGLIMLGIIAPLGGAVESKQDVELMNRAGNSSEWMIVNDGVMGGLSQSRVRITDRNTLLFSGTVSLENNGGFASVRHHARSFDVRQGDGIRLRVKGDGKTYQLRVRTSSQFDGMAYKADFSTSKGEWQDLRIPWKQFQATYRGRMIRDAPPLEGDQIRQVGFLIADKQTGRFELEVEGIGSF